MVAIHIFSPQLVHPRHDRLHYLPPTCLTLYPVSKGSSIVTQCREMRRHVGELSLPPARPVPVPFVKIISLSIRTRPFVGDTVAFEAPLLLLLPLDCFQQQQEGLQREGNCRPLIDWILRHVPRLTPRQSPLLRVLLPLPWDRHVEHGHVPGQQQRAKSCRQHFTLVRAREIAVLLRPADQQHRQSFLPPLQPVLLQEAQGRLQVLHQQPCEQHDDRLLQLERTGCPELLESGGEHVRDEVLHGSSAS
mmetsp:Transcript_4730/g.17172  ORF Transcript_4730/g.17172 Transcript_4730/m.17172 type:complete len:248 (-) Transcript_4730:2297-3040(-)